MSTLVAGQRAVARLPPREDARDLAPLAERCRRSMQTRPAHAQVVGVLFLRRDEPKRIATAPNTSAVPSQPMMTEDSVQHISRATVRCRPTWRSGTART